MALCLDDKVQFRLQWPTAPMLRFNGHQLRVVNRGNGTGLGVMQVRRHTMHSLQMLFLIRG
jgi:hypothetical protein